MGATHVDAGKEKKALKFVKNFWSAIAKREINFFWILLLGMSQGFIILTLKKNDWAWNTGTLHLLDRKNSKQYRLLARFFWLFFGTHKEFTWQSFWKLGRLSIQLGTLKQKKNLQRRVCRVRGSTSRILLLHDNARPYTARATIDALETLKFEVLSHMPYSPDLAPSDFHFFPHLKRDLKGTHFTSDDELKQAVTSWIKRRTPEFFIDSMRKLVLRWEKCTEWQGNYVEK